MKRKKTAISATAIRLSSYEKYSKERMDTIIKRLDDLTVEVKDLRTDVSMGKGVTLGSDSKSDGFYAHMVYGNTKAWVKRVKNKAERASQMAVINKMSSEAMLMAKQYPQ